MDNVTLVRLCRVMLGTEVHSQNLPEPAADALVRRLRRATGWMYTCEYEELEDGFSGAR